MKSNNEKMIDELLCVVALFVIGYSVWFHILAEGQFP